ncbi:MAG: helix-turn-helix transcriptional regulator [Lachnospiraceae bacterium]|nr:helix-turn-helix transcriptional regulator [Lachnospiraceae bacterium]
MTSPSENLKTVIEYLGISKNDMARSLGIDPSLISRWLSGTRKLHAASRHMDALAEYILARCKRVRDMEWLKDKFKASGLPTELSSVYRVKQNLIMWLASDGEDLRRNLSSSHSPESVKNGLQKRMGSAINPLGNAVKLGCFDIVMELEPILANLPHKSEVNIFLSNDQITTVINEDIADLLLQMIDKRDLKFNMVVCISGDTKAVSALIYAYMAALVSGHIKLSVVHGMTQTVTNQMHLIVPGIAAVLVTETPGAASPPVAVVIREESFVAEIQESFERALRYAQPVLTVYGDNFARNILEILYWEFCTPGALDVVKDSINPMYMSEDAYNRILHESGHIGEEYSWRSLEFIRFKSGMDETLKGGTVFREILSLSRLNQIARDGFCRMPGLYFMNKGFIKLNREGCAAILDGYIRYLKNVPNFHILILDDITTLHSDNCWQLKQNHHLAINHWRGSEPVMIHSDQLILLRDFQAHFDKLWELGTGGIGSRVGVIVILEDVLKDLMGNV